MEPLGTQPAPGSPDGDDDPREDAPSKTGRWVVTIIIILLILLLAAIGYFLWQIMSPAGSPLGVSAGQMSWVRSIYGFGETADTLTTPSTVALNESSGNIWVADAGKFRLVEYEPDGSFVSMLTASEETSSLVQFRLPSKIAMDSDGLMYIAEPTYNVVRVFDTQTQTELGEIGVPGPTSLAVNDDFLVVGAESGFAILDKEGFPLHIIGEAGTGENQFDKVNGVAIDEDNVIYVVDTFNNRLSAWNVDGERIWMVETGYPGNQQMTGDTSFETSAPAELQVPMGATIDGAGRLVVADMFDFSLAVFDAENGEFIAKYGEPGNQDGQFNYPSDVDYDPNRDWFVVSDNGARRAQIVRLPDSGGSLIDQSRDLLSGPLRACCFPLLLILLVLLISFVVGRIRRRRRLREAREMAEGSPQGASPDIT
jgi:sugar lactone lactonase YvrE